MSAARQVDAETGEIIDAPRMLANAPSTPSIGGLIQIEQQRAIAEVQARALMAHANPRDPVKVLDLILRDCQRPSLAEQAAYQYSRGGTDIRGPSIRLLEAVARRWGNLVTGVRELSRREGMSECQAFAMDLETGFFEERTFPVKHWRDRSETKGGGYAVTDERDIYEVVANAGARRKRACLESVIPSDVVEAALAQCEQTLRAKADTSPAAIAKMVEAFAAFNVTRAQLEQRLQRRLDAITPAQLVGLKRVYASLRDGMSDAPDWFEPAAAPAAAPPADAPPAPEARPRGRPKKDAGAPKPGPEDAGQGPVADNAAGAAPAAAAGDSGLERRTPAGYQIDIERATDAETAALVLDEARTAGLGEMQLAALTAAWRAKWEPAP